MKEELRGELIKKRKELPKNEVLEKSKQIEKGLFEVDEFKKASTILFYVSYDNEVYTHEMIKECISEKNIVVPVTDKLRGKMILSKLDNWGDLAIGSYNILEPKKEKIKEISIDDVDLIIVPGVGFDERGNRLGHGKGYYDNLLKNSTSLKISLAFDFQIVENIPTEKHDIPVDKIITEKRVIDCKKI